MNSRRIRTKLALGTVLGLAVASTALAAATGSGPSTTTDPHVLQVADGVKVTSLLTVETPTDPGAASNGYQMVGIPDGLGATDAPHGRDFTLFMNHELPLTPPGPGVARRHGANGAFVSELKIGSQSLEVEEGQDHQFVVDLQNEAVSNDAQFRTTYGKNNPAPFDLGSDEEVNWDQTGAAQNTEAAAKGITLNRVEDGAFDPRHPEDFYFVTTEGGKGATAARDGGGLWRLSYEDVERPWEGGTLTLLLDGSEAPFLSKPDNLGFDPHGHLLIQEDPGGNPHLARIVAYEVRSGDRAVLAQFDPALFGPGAPGFITQDEESSGIIDASRFLGEGTFLFDAQVHKAHTDPDKAEQGQLLTLEVRHWKKVFDE
ncbi:MAG TPA: alkaline phosphatase PhoX [Thermoleophilaceae bacterium]